MPVVNIGAELSSLPLHYLISAPLTAAIEGQALAAQTTTDFINNFALEQDEFGQSRAVMVIFSYTRMTADPDNPDLSNEVVEQLSVPLLTITQVPYLRIADLNVNFEFHLRDVTSARTERQFSAETEVETTSSFTGNVTAGGGISKFLGLPQISAQYQRQRRLKFKGSVTRNRERSQTTERKATYTLSFKAVQDPIPEGMQRVLEILNNAITTTAGEPQSTEA